MECFKQGKKVHRRKVRVREGLSIIENPKLYDISSIKHNLDQNYMRGNITYGQYNKMYNLVSELYDFYEDLGEADQALK